MAFTIYNRQETNFEVLAEPDGRDWDVLVQGILQNGVVSGCAVTVQSPAAMAVDVANGTIRYGGSDIAITGATVNLAAAHATNQRIDLIVATTAGGVTVVQGTNFAQTPLIPSLPSSRVALAIVWIPAAATEVNSGATLDGQGKLQDKRVFLPTVFPGLDHGALSGLADDDHPQYVLLAGRSGGQILRGGTASGDDLTLRSTSNATKGTVFIEEADALELASGATAMQLRLREPSGDGSSYISIAAPALAGNVALVLPADDGANLQFLHTDGSGNLTWVTPDHGSLLGLTDDDHSQYALLAGRSGGQTLIGGTASGDDLTLRATSNSGSGTIFLQTEPGVTPLQVDETIVTVTGQMLLTGTISSHGLQISNTISTATGGRSLLRIDGSFTGAGEDAAGQLVQPTFNPSANVNAAYGNRTLPSFSPTTGITIANAIIAGFVLITGSGGGAITVMNGFDISTSYGSVKPATVRGLNVNNVGSASVTTSVAIRIAAQSGSTNNFVFELPADATDPTGGGGAATGRIPCLIGGALRYIPYY